MKAKTIIITILSTLFIVVLLQNTQVVTFQILFWKIAMSRIIFFLSMFVIGFLLGFVVVKITSSKKSKKEASD